jgi:hypothetical protein
MLAECFIFDARRKILLVVPDWRASVTAIIVSADSLQLIFERCT